MAHPMSVGIFIYRLEEPLRKRGDDRVAKKKNTKKQQDAKMDGGKSNGQEERKRAAS